MSMTRREMIKLSAAAFAAGALNIPFAGRADASEEPIEVDKWVKGSLSVLRYRVRGLCGSQEGPSGRYQRQSPGRDQFRVPMRQGVQRLYEHVPPGPAEVSVG